MSRCGRFCRVVICVLQANRIENVLLDKIDKGDTGEVGDDVREDEVVPVGVLPGAGEGGGGAEVAVLIEDVGGGGVAAKVSGAQVRDRLSLSFVVVTCGTKGGKKLMVLHLDLWIIQMQAWVHARRKITHP